MNDPKTYNVMTRIISIIMLIAGIIFVLSTGILSIIGILFVAFAVVFIVISFARKKES
jgi:hypothetical protein